VTAKVFDDRLCGSEISGLLLCPTRLTGGSLKFSRKTGVSVLAKRHAAILSFPVAPFLIACTLTVLSAAAVAQQGVGAKYGSRDPKTCASLKEPAKGVLSAALAVKYVACKKEGEVNGNTLYLLEDLKVEVGGGTPLLQLSMIHRPGGADPNGIVYSIRGSFKQYQCGVTHASGMLKNVDKNCRIYDMPKATGTCYRDNFGEWSCSMTGDTDYGTADQAPPK
jgi:hypothetical protein